MGVLLLNQFDQIRTTKSTCLIWKCCVVLESAKTKRCSAEEPISRSCSPPPPPPAPQLSRDPADQWWELVGSHWKGKLINYLSFPSSHHTLPSLPARLIPPLSLNEPHFSWLLFLRHSPPHFHPFFFFLLKLPKFLSYHYTAHIFLLFILLGCVLVPFYYLFFL